MKANKTEFFNNDGQRCLRSYQTNVCVIVDANRAIRTDEHYSKTTTKQINKFLAEYARDRKVETVSQKVIDEICKR